jgi:eukaryotic translation initiation factor 2C
MIDVAKRVLGLAGGGGAGGGRGGMRGGRGGGRGGFGGGGGPSGPLTQLNPNQIMQLKKVLKGAKFSVTHRSVFFHPFDVNPLQQHALILLLSLSMSIRPCRNPNQTFTIVGFSNIGANAIKFKDANNVETTVAAYFKKAYNVTLKSPNLPCVQYKKVRRSSFPSLQLRSSIHVC